MVKTHGFRFKCSLKSIQWIENQRCTDGRAMIRWSDRFLGFVLMEKYWKSGNGDLCCWWLEPWNLDWLSRNSWECYHPNWRTLSFFRGVGIPPNQYCNWYVTHKPNKISMDEMDQAEQFGISNLMNYIGCYRMNWYWYSKPSNKFRGRFQSPVSTMHFWQEWR